MDKNAIKNPTKEKPTQGKKTNAKMYMKFKIVYSRPLKTRNMDQGTIRVRVLESSLSRKKLPVAHTI